MFSYLQLWVCCLAHNCKFKTLFLPCPLALGFNFHRHDPLPQHWFNAVRDSTWCPSQWRERLFKSSTADDRQLSYSLNAQACLSGSHPCICSRKAGRIFVVESPCLSFKLSCGWGGGLAGRQSFRLWLTIFSWPTFPKQATVWPWKRH